jgi:hypothetical protein
MNNKTEKCKAKDSQRAVSGNVACLFVYLEALKMTEEGLRNLELIKKTKDFSSGELKF